MIETAAEMLVNGTPGTRVMEFLRHEFVDATRVEPRTLSSMNSVMSLVRSAVIARGVRSRDYDDSALRAFASSNTEIESFLNAPLGEQCKIQRSHASNPSWGEPAETALRQLQLLPKTMDSFRLSETQALQLKIDQEKAQIRKNECSNIIHIDHGPCLLKRAIWLLATARTTDSFARLILPLLLCTGRRLSEIVNGRSSFEPVAHPYYARFSGQLKKGGAAGTYVIPLLCDFKTFAVGWMALRQKQLGERQGKAQGESTLTNAEVKRRYEGNTNKYLRKGSVLRLPLYGEKPKACHAHSLRSIYAAYVFELYSCPDTFNRTCMRVLGHTSLAESLSYNAVRLGQMDTHRGGAYGPLLQH
jgi:hypothetical protein